MYSPKDALSNEMISSIPRKVGTWLSLMSIKPELGFTYQEMVLKCDEVEGVVSVTDGDTYVVTWEGEIYSPTNVKISHESLADVSNNLADFIHVENLFYNIMEIYHNELNDQVMRSIETEAFFRHQEDGEDDYADYKLNMEDDFEDE
jgi:hypothetical protein